jgi:hypothetical protein
VKLYLGIDLPPRASLADVTVQQCIELKPTKRITMTHKIMQLYKFLKISLNIIYKRKEENIVFSQKY